MSPLFLPLRSPVNQEDAARLRKSFYDELYRDDPQAQQEARARVDSLLESLAAESGAELQGLWKDYPKMVIMGVRFDKKEIYLAASREQLEAIGKKQYGIDDPHFDYIAYRKGKEPEDFKDLL